MTQKKPFVALLGLFMALFLTGCKTSTMTDDVLLTREQERDQGIGKLFGEGTLTFGGNPKGKQGHSPHAPMNPILWQASMKILSFMPLRQTDPVGGVILSEWVSPKPGVRCKVDVYILGPTLRSDHLKVSFFKEKKIRGEWQALLPAQNDVSERIAQQILGEVRLLKGSYKEKEKNALPSLFNRTPG